MADGGLVARCEVVLVGTANPENLGGVARLAENFAPARLALVAPRARPDDARALVVGRVGRERLAAARVCATLDEALREAAFVVAFSARRGASRPPVALHELAALLDARAPSSRIALVFGPEDAGLAAADIDRCDVVCAIDLPGALPSLNLAQAVAIALWELARPRSTAPPSRAQATRAQATRAELDALVARIASATPDERVQLRRLMAAAALTPADVRMLHGLINRSG